MTLNEELILKDVNDSTFYDKMSIGDHQTKRNEVIFSKAIDNSRSIEKVGQSSVIFNHRGVEAHITKYNCNLNDYLTDQSNVTLTYQSKRSVTSDRALVTLPVPGTLKCCPCVLTNKTIANYGKIVENLTGHSRVAINHPSNITSMQDQASVPHTPDKSICPCLHASSDGELSVGLTGLSNVTVISESKNSFTSDCALISLPVPEMPKCPCVLAQTANTDFDKLSEPLTEKSNFAIISQPDVTVSLPVQETPKCCQCVLDKATNTNKGKHNMGLNEQSNVTVPSESKTPFSPDCALYSLPVSETPKCCQCVLDKATNINNGKHNMGLTDQSNVTVPSGSKTTFSLDCALGSLPVSKTPKCCQCVLSQAAHTNVHKLKDNIIEESNSVMISEPKTSTSQDHELAYLPENETSKCPCFLARKNSTTNGKMSKDLTKHSNVISSELKRSFISLPSSETPKCCPRVLAQGTATNEHKLKTEYPTEKSSVTSQPKTLASQNCALNSRKSKRLGVVPKRTITNVGKLNKNLARHSNSVRSSQPSMLASQHSLVTVSDSHTSKHPRVLKESTTTNSIKLNVELTKPSNVNESSASELERPDMLDCGLVELPVPETTKCCPCILAKANNAIGTTVRSQAEILLEKTGILPDKIGKLSIICNYCINKLESTDTNLGSNCISTAQKTCNKYVSQDIKAQEESIKENKCTERQLKSLKKSEKISKVSNNNKLIRKKSHTIFKGVREVRPYTFLDSFFEVRPKNSQDEIKHSHKEKVSCYHTCLANTTSSEDSMLSDIAERKTQNTTCLDVTTSSKLSNKYNIGNEILNYYSDRKKMYSLDNLFKATTEFNFNGEEEVKLCKIMPDVSSDNHQETTGDIENSKLTEYKNDNYIDPSMNINDVPGDVNKADINQRETVIQSQQVAMTKKDIEIQNSGHDDLLCVKPSKAIFSDLVNVEKLPYLAEKPKTKGIKSNSHRSYNKNTLNTIKENETENTTHNSHHIYCPQAPPETINFSTNYAVNYVHSIEYDLKSRNGNSIFACSLNSYSSTNGKISGDLQQV